ncbi:hypothetical protein MLD59_12780 [Verrucomicrobiaceae bacterium E54]|nr:hypothetical protein [Verrucomicrobiaceae bacterium E54]
MPSSFHKLSAAVWFGFAAASAAAALPQIAQTGEIVTLHNAGVRFEFDLSSGQYRILREGDRHPAISKASLRVNDWSSDDPAFERRYTVRTADGPFGEEKFLELNCTAPGRPELLFTVALHEGDFFSLGGGIVNTGNEPVQLRELHVMADAQLYPGADMTRDFAMIDGFSGGEPLEYGERFYSPLTRANALKSRNNILLNFTGDDRRHVMVMGGLSYHDFEKFATIAQTRRTELAEGSDGKPSLLCYLDLPREKSDRAEAGETLELIEGAGSRTWHYHEFRCRELATSVEEPDRVVVEARDLRTDRPYTLGFSWWRGFQHGEYPDVAQSVIVEYERDGRTRRLPLVENRTLPRFDGTSKQDVEQVELPLPAEAVKSGSLRIVVEKSAAAQDHVYLGEVWLRDGRHEALLPARLTPVSECPRPRRAYSGQLFASDPVGKRVDAGQRYVAPDRFYIDVTGSDPFTALESYALRVREAQQIDLSMYDFPTVCLWYAADTRYGSGAADNTTLGAVNEMKVIADSGFLKYSRVAVRLVPDSYMPDNQQGWWDDEHWQRDDTDRDTTQNGRYVEPYETSEKWGKAVTELGGIPLTYFQTAYRSEDYVRQFPGHMLFNKRYAWKGEPVDTEGEVFTTWQQTWRRNGRVVWGYDFTDPEFLSHMRGVYANLRKGGIKGLMFDYPASGWAKAGGMEDEASTTAAAYRTIFRLAHDGLGPGAYVHERNMERGSDVTLGVVASMRTENDTDALDRATVTRCGMRWYKNRVVVNQDADSKDLVELQGSRDRVRAVLTMSYVTTGRLLLANSFSEFSPETFHDLTRTFPYHTAARSARPVDAFLSGNPAVFDFEVDPGWHQVTFFNADPDRPKTVGIDLSGPQERGALGLDPEADYYLFDFWNDRFLGRQAGDSRIEQELRPGEARMISVRRCLDRPQVLSTDRHLMQGYLDLDKVRWDAESRVLSGVSKIIGGDPYRIALAANGKVPVAVECDHAGVTAELLPPVDGVVGIRLHGPENASVRWSVRFAPEG